MKENSHPERLECPGCGSSSFTTSPGGSLICNYCHAAYVLPERVCPACGAPNPPVARKCVACGQEMKILESLFARVTGTRGDWLREVREEAPAIKAQEEAASRARLADMWAADTRRREALMQAQAERDRQQRIMWNVAFVILVVVAVLIMLAVVASRIPSPYLY